MLGRLYTEVSQKLEAQNVARNMFQLNALTLKDLQSIQSQRSEPIKAAEQLINIVMENSVNIFSRFLDALKATGHQHVYECMVTGSFRGITDNALDKVTTMSSSSICFSK